MKWTGFTTLACAAAFTVACNGTGRDARDNDVDTDRSTTADMRSDETVGTAGQTPALRPGQAQAPGGSTHGQDGDARYLAEHAAMAGNAEVELGQLASQRAQSAQVREFAQMMVRDHSKSGSELKQTLSAHNVAAPTGLDAEHRQLKERLSTLNGADFDREYMKAMVEGHKEVKSLLEGQTSDTYDPRGPKPTGTSGTSSLGTAVKHWASASLPRVNEHLQKAEQIYAKVR